MGKEIAGTAANRGIAPSSAGMPLKVVKVAERIRSMAEKEKAKMGTEP